MGMLCAYTFPDWKQKVFTLSYDDGNDCDRPLVDMMRKYRVKGTFNINSGQFRDEGKPINPEKRWRRMTAKQALEVYGDDMEIAIHGRFHPFWDRQTTTLAMADILYDKQELERLTGRIIRGSAAPNGGMSDDVAEILRLADVAYCRLVGSTLDLRVIPEDFRHLYPTAKYSDPKLPKLAKQFVEGTPHKSQLWMLYVWGHSFEHMRENDWNLIEDLLKTVSGKEDVWYCTNIELVDYVNAAKQLRYNVDCTMVENPTSTDIWLKTLEGDKYILKPGECKKIREI